MRLPVTLGVIALAVPAQARDPILSLPVDCVLGETCYVQNYMDHDPSPGAADLTCGPQSYDGHKGTDFALVSLAQMRAGVAVRAAAPGTVRAVRDGMADVAADSPGAPDISGRECGNGVVVNHGGGWETQYCHLKQGSIAVRRGQRVGKATVLGEVGLSGDTEFPHLHLGLRHDGAEIDPFLPLGIVQCGVPPPPGLWEDGLAYQPGGLIAAGIASGVPDFAAVLDDASSPDSLPGDTPALVVWGTAHGTRAGDRIRLTLRSPDGLILDRTEELTRSRARVYRAAGRKAPGTWPAGLYQAEVLLLRDGETLDRKQVAFRIDPP
ncbi:M23 family metallopeptidase [Frigidibacter sp. ROC022]|uniref:M23 family metallopeptidase n=1 Tax=Frigidibacter sp. ROC022 TaxID=2971796 RepID=UPI00215A0D73|nr:M23 family metallopeptidase [Frigidibacter sp. ROC022]MCR8722923.1 M23 family metallopeptidase [Frigidibacter sp. ROC022]